MTQQQCNQLIHALTIVLKNALAASKSIPATTEKELKKRLSTEKSDELTLFHDGTEREIPRPKDNRAQKEFYSGKKGRHTVKNGIIATLSCMILFVTASVSGFVHDKKMADNYYKKALEKATKKIVLYQDLGFLGFATGNANVIMPCKKPRGKEQTDDQKASNRKISSARVRIEHTIGSVKRYRIVKDECRLWKNEYSQKIFFNLCRTTQF